MNSKTFIIKILSNKDIIHFKTRIIDNIQHKREDYCVLDQVYTLGDYTLKTDNWNFLQFSLLFTDGRSYQLKLCRPRLFHLCS